LKKKTTTEVLRWTLSHIASADLDVSLIASAARGGDPKIFQTVLVEAERWCYQKDGTVVRSAIESGDTGIFEIARSFEFPIPEDAWKAAVQVGNLEALTWLHESHLIPGWDREICTVAAEKGYKEILQFLQRKGCPWKSNQVFSAALRSSDGDVYFLAWLKEVIPRPPPSACIDAVRSNKLKVVEWAQKNLGRWSYDMMMCLNAAEAGNLELLTWLRQQKCPWNVQTANALAARGDLQTLKWAKKNKCPWDKSTAAYAAASGNLDLLKWMRKVGCPWDARVCLAAAQKRYWTLLRWAKENGCLWTLEAYEITKELGGPKMEAWAKQWRPTI
jgi:hypothetical protein